jgi:hypothetical protein
MAYASRGHRTFPVILCPLCRQAFPPSEIGQDLPETRPVRCYCGASWPRKNISRRCTTETERGQCQHTSDGLCKGVGEEWRSCCEFHLHGDIVAFIKPEPPMPDRQPKRVPKCGHVRRINRKGGHIG